MSPQSTGNLIPQHIFREYDIRGIALPGYGPDVELTPDFTRRLGFAFATKLKIRRKMGTPRVVIGRDARQSGEILMATLSDGLRAGGVDVVNIGQAPTPCTYLAEWAMDVDGAIQVTGSHNPVEMNGFKMLTGGAALFGPQIQEIRKVIEKGEFSSGDGSEISIDFLPQYIDALTVHFDRMPGLKIAVDCGNGTSGPAIVPALKRLGITATVLYADPDGTFPNHHADPTVEANLRDLKAAVAEKQASMGVAFDGDSDRIGAVDDRGRVLWGDQLLLLFARDILQRKPGASVVGEVKCSKVLYDGIRLAGGIPEMYKTGHSLIKARMKELGSVIAGEMSGHIFFQDRWMGFDDANYAALRLCELVHQAGVTLGDIADTIPVMRSTPEIRIGIPEEIKFRTVAAVTDSFRSDDRYKLIDIDGARVENEYGWGLVRASNTQAVLVCRFEADTDEHLNEIREDVENKIREARKRFE